MPYFSDRNEGALTVWFRLKRNRSASIGSTGDDKGISGALALGLDDDDEVADDEIPLSELERALATRVSALRSRLRELLIVQHSAQFLVGSAYFKCAAPPVPPSLWLTSPSPASASSRTLKRRPTPTLS